MNKDVDLTFLKRRVAELEDGKLLSATEMPDLNSESTASVDRGHTESDTHLIAIKTDLRYLRSSVASLDGATAALRERMGHLPSKGFVIATSLGSLAVITALVTFQNAIQTFLKVMHAQIAMWL
jgi:hypothetical protein